MQLLFLGKNTSQYESISIMSDSLKLKLKLLVLILH